MRRRTTRSRLLATVLAAALLILGTPALPGVAAGGPNLAAGKATAESGHADVYGSGNITDGNQASYWESTNNAFPQWVQVDLGSTTSVDQIKIKLPTGWGARTETLSVQGSTTGSGFSTIVASAGYTFDPAGGNTVTVNFTATSTRYVRLNITANTAWPAGQISELEVYGTSTSTGNLAAGKTMSESGHNQSYVASNANDANQATYWESVNNAFPQWLQVDLGSSVSINKVVAKLPTGWGARTQNITIQGSATGSSFTDIVAATGYTFDPASGNTVTINFGATTTRYVRLVVNSNSGWVAGQISEFEVYGSGTGDTQAPTVPGSLAYTQTTGQIKLTWTASTDNVGVTAYDIYRNGAMITSVPSATLTYTDAQPDSATVSYFVRARDAAGNQSGNSNTVTRTGQTGDQTAPTAPSNLAYTTPASGQIKLTWTASVDNVGVTGYDIYANGAVRASVNGSTLTYTDTQPDTATVSYYVTAKDAAANVSIASNTVTRVGSGGTGTNLAVGKPVSGTTGVFTFVATNANDNDVTTYYESSVLPGNLAVNLGANADITSIVLKLNPDTAWGTRTQNIQVLSHNQDSTTFTNLVSAANYTFNPAAGANTVTIPVSVRASAVQLVFNSNTGAPGGQVAEFQIMGTPAPNPDLQVTNVTWAPASPIETDAITLSTTVANTGSANAAATNVNLYLGTTKVGTTAVPALAAGASTTVTTNIGTQNAATYSVTAKVDESNTVVEQNDANNSFTKANLVVAPIQTSDLVPSAVSWSPGNPSAGNTVTFSAAILNQGTIASAAGAHGITLTLLDANGATVKTLTGSYSGTLAAGASSGVISLGTWTAVNGKYTVRATVAVDANEQSVKQGNNTTNSSFFVGRGANMPYDMYEAENGTVGGGATVIGPNRTIGDLAGEASGRKAVTLNSTGAYVQWTTRASTNTLVTRFSIPDSAGGGGTTATLNVYVDGTFLQTITLNSKYAWLYGAETGPGNSPGSGPRHIYDEASFMLNQTVGAGHTIKLQKDTANSSQYAIDYINTEQVSPVANPDPAHYKVPAGFAQQDIQNAIDTVRMDTTGTWTGVYLPAGQYAMTGKLQVYGKATKVVGAGPWYTQLVAPSSQSETDIGFDTQSGSDGSSFSNLAIFGNYTFRQDGPGKPFNLTNLSNITVDNVWIEHTVVAIWGTHINHLTATNMRIRDTFADGINLTNGSQDNLVSNNDARSTGDDSFALFAATDLNSSDLKNNTFQNLSSTTTWRAAGLAVYGGYANTFKNIYIADTLVYSAITISSLDFGYPFTGFGASPPTVIQNVSLVRDGGHFWGAQVFPAIWCFSASKAFQGIRVSDVDITDPTYAGIMFQTNYAGGTAQNPVTDTTFTNITISGAVKSGDAYDAKSGYGIWANPSAEAGQGPAVGSATFTNVTFSNNFLNVYNPTTTFTINGVS